MTDHNFSMTQQLPPAPAGVDDPVGYRSRRLGASELAAALGFDRWASPYTLVAYKRGFVSHLPDSPAADVGRHMEPFIRRWFASLQPDGTTVQTSPSWTEGDLLLASPDGEVRYPDGATVGLECKWRSPYDRDHWGEPGSDDVPIDVKLQCIGGMICTGWPSWRVAVIFGTGTDRGVYIIPRDEELVALVKARAEEFVGRYLLPDIPTFPDPAGIEAERALLRRRFPKASDTVRPPTDRETDLALAFHAASQRVKTWEGYRDLCKTRLMAHIGDAKGIGARGWTCYWSPVQPAPSIDWKAVAEAAFGLIAKRRARGLAKIIAANTITPPPYRRFAFYPRKGFNPDDHEPDILTSPDAVGILRLARANHPDPDGIAGAIDGRSAGVSAGGAGESDRGGAVPDGAAAPAATDGRADPTVAGM
jgi:hypothetical protein